MSKFTRRSVPALFASTAGLVAGFDAYAKADADPIFAKIRAVHEAQKVADQASKMHERAERQCYSEQAKVPVLSYDGKELRTHADVDRLVSGLSRDIEMRVILHQVLVRRGNPLGNAQKCEPSSDDLEFLRQLRALRERLKAQVTAYQSAHKGIEVRIVVPAEAAMHRALEIRDKLSDEALATVPTTAAGAAALVAFARHEAEVTGVVEDATKALATLAVYLSRIA